MPMTDLRCGLGNEHSDRTLGLAGRPTSRGCGSGDERGGPLEPLTYLALNGSLGTGYREESLDAGLERPVEFIGVDSGSTDGGPFYLGSGEWIWSMAAYERDLRLGLLGARRLGIPLIIGSCGGGGNDSAVDGYLELVDRIVTDAGVHARVACVKTEVDRDLLVQKYRGDKLRALLGGAPDR